MRYVIRLMAIVCFGLAAHQAGPAQAETALAPGLVFRDCADVCPEMVVLPAGEFMMGSPPGEWGRFDGEGPQRKVSIARPFAVGKFEVTFAEWEACVAGGGCASNASPSDSGWGKGRRPVINVSWNDAKEYAGWLSRKTGRTYRLLSEAEWEYATRAGTVTRYHFGDNERDLCTYANVADLTAKEKKPAQGPGGPPIWPLVNADCRDGYVFTAPVGTFQPNAFGLYDMHGNVWEWVEDTWHPNYQGSPTDGSVWQEGDMSRRVLRGGSWFVSGPDYLRSASRARVSLDSRDDTGFRVARTL